MGAEHVFAVLFSTFSEMLRLSFEETLSFPFLSLAVRASPCKRRSDRATLVLEHFKRGKISRNEGKRNDGTLLFYLKMGVRYMSCRDNFPEQDSEPDLDGCDDRKYTVQCSGGDHSRLWSNKNAMRHCKVHVLTARARHYASIISYCLAMQHCVFLSLGHAHAFGGKAAGPTGSRRASANS